ncbi:hypothetical protein TNCV_2825431 [Trichonephila clavipes]|nr:hypothetical protein TNCV_2825431 [Trichonephila clavipes]
METKIEYWVVNIESLRSTAVSGIALGLYVKDQFQKIWITRKGYITYVVNNVDPNMLTEVSQEQDYDLHVGMVTKGSHI